MPNLQKADDFFSNHLLKEQYFEFPEPTRSAAVAAAARDITAALKREEFPEDAGDLIYSAVFEQAIYLLLNPHIVTGATDAAKQDIISPRAQAMLFDRCTDDDSGSGTPGDSGDNSGSGSSNSGGDGSGNGSTSGDTDSGNTGSTGNNGTSGNTGSGANSGSIPTINPSIQLHLYRG